MLAYPCTESERLLCSSKAEICESQPSFQSVNDSLVSCCVIFSRLVWQDPIRCLSAVSSERNMMRFSTCISLIDENILVPIILSRNRWQLKWSTVHESKASKEVAVRLENSRYRGGWQEDHELFFHYLHSFRASCY